MAHDAVAIASRTDGIVQQGNALLALARVLRTSRAIDEARETLRQALELFDHKENIVQAEQTRALLAEVEFSMPSSSSGG